MKYTHVILIMSILILNQATALMSNPLPPPDTMVPWAIVSNAPVITSSSLATPEGKSLGSDACHALLSLYRHCISRFIATRCPMSPSCSSYSMEAIARYGPARGMVMTADRLIHEFDEQRQPDAIVIRINGERRYYDPVRNNDFWWAPP